MTQDQLVKSIRNGLLSGAILFEGEEETKKEGALRYLLEEVLPSGMELMNETILENPELASVLDASRQFPFMCDKRVVVAKDPPFILKSNKGKKSEDNDENEEKEEKEAEDVQPDLEPGEETVLKTLSEEDNPTCITVIFIRGKLKKNTAAYKWFQKHDRLVSFEPLSIPELIKIVQKNTKKQGYEISYDVAELFVTSIGRDLTRLNSELDKLIGYKSSGTQINEDDVFAIITQDIEAVSFQIMDKFCVGDYAQAYRILNALLEDRQHPAAIQAGLLWQIRNLCHCAVLKKSGVGYKDASIRLKTNEYPCKKAYEQCTGIPCGNLVSLYRIAVHNENEFKKGRLDARFSLDDLMAKMCKLIVRKA